MPGLRELVNSRSEAEFLAEIISCKVAGRVTGSEVKHLPIRKGVICVFLRQCPKLSMI